MRSRLSVVVTLFGAGLTLAQPRPAFEVASIKPAAPGSGPVKGEVEGTTSIAPGTLRMRNVTLRDMILAAYGIKDHQLSGPSWLKSDRYDVAAKSETPAAGDQIRLMLEGLLADRFKLEIHRETRDLAVVAMVVGKNGTRLGAPKPEGPSTIGLENGKVVFQNWSMGKLADYLSQRSGGRPVVDSTGMGGFYDFSVQLDAASDNPADVKRAVATSMRDGSFPATVADAIGLKLETRKGPVEIIVVDNAQRSPTEN